MTPLYIVWREYQRRAEVLAPRLGADLLFMPHIFTYRMFRPLDYLFKFFKTIIALLKDRPKYVIFQAPPLFTVLPALLLRIDYIIDAHNAVFQSWWGKLPFSKIFLRHAKCVIAHNEEILSVARKTWPEVKFLEIRDPLEIISRNVSRNSNSYLFVCSFNQDEPIQTITEVVAKNPSRTFYFTANPLKLNIEQRKSLEALDNARFTGFLPVEEYQALLSSCAAAIVLTTRPATQPSGACEALSSDTPLILSRTSLTEKLFGDWALLVDNTSEEISSALDRIDLGSVNFAQHRDAWAKDVDRSLRSLTECL